MAPNTGPRSCRFAGTEGEKAPHVDRAELVGRHLAYVIVLQPDAIYVLLLAQQHVAEDDRMPGEHGTGEAHHRRACRGGRLRCPSARPLPGASTHRSCRQRRVMASSRSTPSGGARTSSRPSVPSTPVSPRSRRPRPLARAPEIQVQSAIAELEHALHERGLEVTEPPIGQPGDAPGRARRTRRWTSAPSPATPSVSCWSSP